MKPKIADQAQLATKTNPLLTNELLTNELFTTKPFDEILDNSTCSRAITQLEDLVFSSSEDTNDLISVGLEHVIGSIISVSDIE